jgi:hypothetical protein
VSTDNTPSALEALDDGLAVVIALDPHDPFGPPHEIRVPGPTRAQLRQAVLAVCVLEDVDLTPMRAGVRVHCDRPDGSSGVQISWHTVATVVGNDDPLADEARARVSRLLRLARTLGARPDMSLRDILRPVGLPAAHALHPGLTWLRDVPMGCALGLGLGLLGVEDDPDAVTLPPAGLLEALDVDVDAAWQYAKGYLDDMGAIAAARLHRAPNGPLRPMGDCDVLTLLGSRTFRRALTDLDRVGVRAVAAPMRRRGWLDPDHVDAVFTRTAAAATAPADRGFSRPVLVTVDGVWECVEGDYDHALELALREQRGGENTVREHRFQAD